MRVLFLLVVGTIVLTACATAPHSATDARIKIVAAENFWGDIAGQIGGDRAQVVSIIANPATDPHDYEPTAADSRTVAEARIAIVNGVGYDAWADKLIAANPNADRTVLNVGGITAHKDGDNPHRWYSPGDVQNVTVAIVTALTQADPLNTAYYDQQKQRFLNDSLSTYNKLITEIQTNFNDAPVGATESIFAPLADALRLNLVTPPQFLNAISEGSAPTAVDKKTVDEEIARRQIRVLIYNAQNATPDVEALVQAARTNNIPVAAVTETLSPTGTSFQDWQTRQLQALETALETTAHG